MSLINLFILSFWLSFHVHASTGIFIGNGGDGVEVGNRLFVKDLFLAHAHENPYFGNEIDPGLPGLPDETTIEFGYPRELLARKLTDLNKALPGLGDYLLASMKVYHWKLQDLPLRKIVGPEQIVAYPAGLEQIQIANRFQFFIRIDRAAYARLDDANRVALLLHEAVFSLVRPFPVSDGRAYQSVHVVRDLVGLFFQPEFFEMSEIQTQLRISPTLNIPYLVLPLSDLRKSPTWQISAADEMVGSDGFGTITTKEVWRYPTFIKSMRDIDNSIRFICRQVRKQTGLKKFDLTVEFDTRPAILRTEPYLPPGNFPVPQVSLRFEVVLQKDRLISHFTSDKQVAQCEQEMNAKKEWFIRELNWLQ